MSGPFRRIPEDTSLAIADAIRSGRRLVDVAREFDLNATTVRNHAIKHGALDAKPRPRRHRDGTPVGAVRATPSGDPPGYWSSTPDVTPELARAAARQVCAHAAGTGEARDLILMLGLGPLLRPEAGAA